MAGPQTRNTLLLRIRNDGDDYSWGEFVELYTPLLFSFSLKRGLQPADAHDVVQEVMRSLARALRNFEYDPAKGTFRSWLYTVTRNEVNRVLKHNAKRPLTGGSSVVALLDSTPDAKEERDWDLDYRRQMFHWACERARPDFSEQHWRAFMLTALEGKRAEEVAAELECTKAAVYIAKSKIVKRLREIIHSVAAESWELDAVSGNSG